MPRYKKSIATAKNRRDKYGYYRTPNVYEWIDPYPDVLGTSPEKRVYARFKQMGIAFYFQSDFKVSLPLIDLYKTYRPDFYIPSIKLVIEVNGEYFHTKPDVIKDDAYKYALYEAMGYKVIAWWDYEIENNLDTLIAREPLLNRYSGAKGGRLLKGNEKNIDDLKGLRKQNQSKRKPYNYYAKIKREGIRKVSDGYSIK